MLRPTLLAACLLLAFAAVQSDAAVTGCSFDGHDFSALAGSDITGSDGAPKYAYYLSVCGVLKTSAASGCLLVASTSSACQVEVTGGSQSFDVGNWVPGSPAPVGPQWSYIDAGNKNKGVLYTMQGGLQCWATGQETTYTANVHLTCADKQGALTVFPVPNTCMQNYTLPTPLACVGSSGGGGGGGGGKKGLSGGWVFIILLCVLIPLYVVGGCVYKSQKLGATGMDKCPNVEFWRDLPSLVKDGFAFTFAKIRGLCGGGGGASGANTYETM